MALIIKIVHILRTSIIIIDPLRMISVVDRRIKLTKLTMKIIIMILHIIQVQHRRMPSPLLKWTMMTSNLAGLQSAI